MKVSWEFTETGESEKAKRCQKAWSYGKLQVIQYEWTRVALREG